MLFEADLRKSDLESVPKQFDLNGIPAGRCNCSYVLGQTLIWRTNRSSKSFFAFFLIIQ
ncbi:hypothetical protein LEP1GSC051_1758 [Leptospira sp. P2653]|nr:hypothetical protein LEP1GSC051_1758 [Leptospira sp. P2653]